MKSMYKKVITVLISIYLIIGFSKGSLTFGQSGNSDIIRSDTTGYVYINIDTIEVKNNAFKVGEKLTFSIDYGPINAGMATISLTDTVNYRNRKCYKIVSEAFSSKSFSMFFKVEDKMESLMNSRGIFSWRIDKNINEGRYHRNETYELDYLNNVAYSKNDSVKLTHIVQDALSSLFYIRTQPLKIGTSFMLPHFDNGKFYELEIRIVKREKIKVKAGIFDTILVEPLLSSVGVFKHGGHIKVWLTNDEKKMPVKMTTKIKLGSIGLGEIGSNLVKYEGVD